jgi:hypothetical protein
MRAGNERAKEKSVGLNGYVFTREGVFEVMRITYLWSRHRLGTVRGG